LIHTERNDDKQASDEYDRQIKDVRAHLENLDRDYDKLISTKSSLNSEITSYRKLLEGDEKRYDKLILVHLFLII
jgi:outer membrane protein TolC